MGYNPLKVSETLYKRKIVFRPPPPEILEILTHEERASIPPNFNVFLKELPESRRKRRQNSIIDQKKGRGGAQIRFDRQRDFDWTASLMDWDFTTDGGFLRDDSGNKVKNALTVTPEDSNKLPLNQHEFNALPSYLTEQILDHIEDLHAVPEDESAEAKDEDGDAVRLVRENPTSENSVARLGNG